MHTVQIGGPIGSFPDPVTGQPVACSAFGNATFNFNGDPESISPQLKGAILQAVSAVVAEKLAGNQVALPTLSQSLPHFVPEIVARANVQAMGVQITQLTLSANVQSAPAAAPQPMQMPPTPMQSAANAFGQAAADHLDPRNREYEARINVGGFKIKASTDGGLDTAGLGNQVVGKAKSAIIWYAAGCLILLIVGLGLVGLGGYIYWEASKSTSTPTGPGKAAKWDGKSPFSCAGSDNVKLEGVTANLASGTAVSAAGNCHLELVNCNITAPTGIETGANAVVDVKGGSVNGAQFSAKALGTSKINFAGTKVTGKTQALGGAKITGP